MDRQRHDKIYNFVDRMTQGKQELINATLQFYHVYVKKINFEPPRVVAIIYL